MLVIADGRIQDAGTFQELVDKRGAFADFIQQYLTEAPEEELERKNYFSCNHIIFNWAFSFRIAIT